MKKLLVKIPLKFLKYTGITLISILALMFLLPILFPGFVSDKIKLWANKSIEGELKFTKARLSFFNHFPSLTLTLYDVDLKGSAPYKQDTLVAAKEVALGIDVTSVFSKTLKIDKIFVTNGKLNVLVNEKGLPNYNIYKGNEKLKNADTTTSNAALKLDRIEIENCALVYKDLSIPLLLQAQKLNYIGKGDLSKEIFDLTSNIQMQGFDVIYDDNQYLQDKSVDASLITRINTNSLELDFQKNILTINQLPVEIQGKFNFLKNGYHLDFNAKTPLTSLKNIFTALPPAYVAWANKTTVEGKVQLNTTLNGDFIVSENKAPNFHFDILVKNGNLLTKFIQEPLSNIQLKLNIDLPALNADMLQVKVDTIHALLGTDFIKGMLSTKGITNPYINANLAIQANTEKWTKFFALDSVAGITLKGLLKANILLNGNYNKANKQLPITKANIIWSNGYVKTPYYANAVTNIMVDADVFNNKGNTQDLRVAIKPISLLFENQPFTLTAKLNNLESLAYNITAKGQLNIGRLYKMFKIQGYSINGLIKADIDLQGTQANAAAGRYHLLKNKGSFKIQNIGIKTPYYPHVFMVTEGNVHVKNDLLVADNLNLTYQNSSIQAKGKFSNIINYLLKENEPLKGDVSVKAKKIILQDFMNFTEDSSSKSNTAVKSASTVIMLPSNLQLNMQANINSIDYDSLLLSNCNATVTLANSKLQIPNASFEVAASKVNMQASYTPLHNKRAAFTYQLNTTDIDIQKAYKEVKLFREMLTSAAKVKGEVQINYALQGLLNEEMYPVLPTLKGGGTVTVKNAKVYGLKLFNAISKKTGKEDVANPDLSKKAFQLKTTIKNNIVYIDKIKLRVAGFRPRFEGQVSLDGKLNLKARLGLPPFGIFGIPLSITGTQEKPIVKLRRGKAADNLEETEADEEDKKDAAEAEQQLKNNQ